MRTNEAIYPAKDKQPASRHEDLVVIYTEGGATKADYFDSEGHTIRYDVQSPAPGKAVFVSLAGAPGPRYRLSYATAANGVLEGSFEIAAPGTPDAFKPYLSWRARKR